ncbi:MAG TPA: efflux RND transporter periplasmic adaptor subunit, partial [Candidatus Methylomirabilis sp.]|nr:efflux RND transporter periplasmic adaptor subunit [Candidatus Methylomirabilis sp.]
MAITRRKRILAVAVAAVLIGSSTLAWRWGQRDPKDTLLASGTIEATQVDVSFRIPGRVIERPVDEGDRLEAGRLVGRLESRELEAEVDRLRASLQATETRLPQLRTEIALQLDLTRARIADAQATLTARDERLAELKSGSRPQDIQKAWAEVREARAVMENAQVDFRRMDGLFRDGGVAEQVRDAARTNYTVTVERHRNALERLDLVKEGPRQEEIRRAEAEVRQAKAGLLLAQTGELDVLRKRQELATLQASIARDRAALAAAEAQMSYTVLKSPQAGIVLRKHVEPGEMIAAGTPAVTIADLGSIWLKIYIPEPQLGRIKLGQTAEITTDSYRGKVYRGKVTFINSEAEFTPKNVQTQEERVKLVFAVK